MLTGKLGPYQLVKKIAVGGMAEIYRAIVPDTEPLRQVAIKVLHPHNSEDPDFVRMLLDEARLAVRLKHPNIVTTYDLGKEEDQYYLVMELVEGLDLFRLEQRATESRTSVPVPIAAFIIRDVLRGLHFAHELSDLEGKPLHVVHRDVSPQNVLLSYDGAVKLTDFGIAKAEGRSEQTQLGIIKGKYYYMSPEQASGHPLDRRTDLFACGILLYELLAGEMLYYDQNIERLLEKVRRADVPHIAKRRPDTPQELERIMMRALKRRPEERYRTAEEMAFALDAFLRRHAPSFSAADLGKFVEKVQKAQAKKRSADEPTAALNFAAEKARRMSARDSYDGDDEDKDDEKTPTPTQGVDDAVLEQLRSLGVRDDNSLLFQSGKLKALLQQGAKFSKSRDDADADPQGTERGVRPPDDSDITTHKRLAPRAADAAPPKAVFLAITPETEAAGLLIDGAELLPHPVELGQAGAAKKTDNRPDFSGPLYPKEDGDRVGDGVTAVAPVAELAQAASKRRAASRPSRAPRSQPQPQPHSARDRLSEPKLELLQSDVSYDDSEPAPLRPAVELLQSDDFSPLHTPARAAVQKKSKPASVVYDEQLVAEPSSQIDIISTEMTHDALSAPSHLSSEPVDQEASVKLAASRSRLLFVVAGISAAVISATLTWFLVIFPQPKTHVGLGPPDLSFPADFAFPQDLSHTSSGVPDAAARTTPQTTPNAAKAVPAQDKQKPEAGQVLVRSEPPGATVFLDKEELGQTPLLLLRQTPGEDFKIELLLDGFKKGRKRIKWKDKDRLDVKVKLRSQNEAAGGTDEETEKEKT
ncbi:MAG TPA: protein kinase [Pseudomonadota bacterium]|nr:protein kinase [Pseudomonadota bacterium]HMU39742.1 protein kinase [Pseudomonadota bacterium]